ncbi:hypothetical protein WN51_01258 [Melipona quadrifasciata]|uniref:Uncharacterized protein n=1 Tax=Melipona quadrifasciata TaxID=166423 RepID=A0A0M8ZZC4_9HYME|nr:hypothetical protein WN51_01258 [Melipona quadrifasciata]
MRKEHADITVVLVAIMYAENTIRQLSQLQHDCNTFPEETSRQQRKQQATNPRRTTHLETRARFLENATLPRSSRCRGILLSKGPLSYPERQSQHLERFFKGKIGKQRASWLAPRSHVDTFAPIKGQSPGTRHIHSTVNHQSVSSSLT